METSGAVEIEAGHRIVVYLDRRSHNPILREANPDKDRVSIQCVANHRLEFDYITRDPGKSHERKASQWHQRREV